MTIQDEYTGTLTATKRYYRRHREKVLEHNRMYHKKHKKRIQEYQRQYRAKKLIEEFRKRGNRW